MPSELLDDYIQAACHECGSPVTNGNTYCMSCHGRHLDALGERAEMLQHEESDRVHDMLSTIEHLATRPDMPMHKAMEKIAAIAKRGIEAIEARLPS